MFDTLKHALLKVVFNSPDNARKNNIFFIQIIYWKMCGFQEMSGVLKVESCSLPKLFCSFSK